MPKELGSLIDSDTKIYTINFLNVKFNLRNVRQHQYKEPNDKLLCLVYFIQPSLNQLTAPLSHQRKIMQNPLPMKVFRIDRPI